MRGVPQLPGSSEEQSGVYETLKATSHRSVDGSVYLLTYLTIHLCLYLSVCLSIS